MSSNERESPREFENVRQFVLALPRRERTRLVAVLLASTDGPPSSEMETVWGAEIARRIAEVELAKPDLIEADEFIRETRLLLRQSAMARTMPSDELEQARHVIESLSAMDREALAVELLTGLEYLLDEQSDAEWAAEILRRIAEIKAGTAELIDAGVVIAELRRESKAR